MADHGPKQPLVSSSSDPTPLTNQNTTPNRTRQIPYKGNPVTDNVPEESNRIGSSLPHSESIFVKFYYPIFRVEFVILALYLSTGTILFYFFGHQMKGKKTNGLIDAIYFCIVTMTTLGYGDLVPDTILTKLLACAFVFAGMALVGLVLSKAADHLIEKQEILLLNAFNDEDQTSINNLKETKVNKARYKCIVVLILLLMLIIVGVIFLVFVEEMNFVDAFYCVCCTIATLGYGDKSFSTEGGRIFAVFWILISTICLAQFLIYVAEFKTERKQRKIVEQVLNKRMSRADVETADLDSDRNMNVAEFIIYQLKQMGKITDEDVSVLKEKFNQDSAAERAGT